MKNHAAILVLATLTGSFVLSAFSESRIWTDENGKTLEAEHVRTLDDKVVLKLDDGSEIKVSLDTLKKEDRRYAILLTPPRVEIQISIDTDRENKGVGPDSRGPGFQVQKELVQASVSLRKTSSAPYEAPLMSEVYLIGKSEQSDHYLVLDHTKSKFEFTTENNNEHEYRSGSVSLEQLEAGQQKGVEYEGYIAVVRDRAGNIIALKCSKLVFAKNAETIIGSSKGDVFDSEFRPVDRQDAKKSALEQRDKADQKRMPGRRF